MLLSARKHHPGSCQALAAMASCCLGLPRDHMLWAHLAARQAQPGRCSVDPEGHLHQGSMHT